MVLVMVNQYRAFWSIPNAGPSMSTFHGGDSSTTTSGAQTFATAVRAFFNRLTSVLPNDVSVTFDTEVVRLDTATGQLVDSVGVTPGATVAGSSTGTWAAGSGGRIVWNTGVILAGRRVLGSTFIVPMGGALYTDAGRVSATGLATMQTAADNLISELAGTPTVALCVYSRPRPGIPGAVSTVTAGAPSSQVATLRGRKY